MLGMMRSERGLARAPVTKSFSMSHTIRARIGSFPDGSALALGTEVAGSSVHLDRIDRGSAPAARLALPSVDPELALELPGLAQEVDVGLVGQRGAAVPHGLLEHFAHGPVQAPDLLRGQRVAHVVVAKARGEEHLVGIDVAQA